MQASDKERLENLVGAFVLGLSDRLHDATETSVGHSGAGAAALVLVGQYPGLSVEQLSHPLGLSHSATVRAVDRLATQGFVKREPSGSGPAVAVVPTEAGRQKAREIVEIRQRTIRAALAGVTDAEAQRLTTVLERGLATLSDRPETTVCRLCDAGRCRRPCCPVVQRQIELGNHPPDPVPLPLAEKEPSDDPRPRSHRKRRPRTGRPTH